MTKPYTGPPRPPDGPVDYVIRDGTPEEYEEAQKRAVEAGWDGVDEVTVLEWVPESQEEKDDGPR